MSRESILPLTMTVRDAMDTNIVSVDAEMAALDAVRLMVEKNVWSVVVTRNGKFVGLMTERDFLRRCVKPGLDAAETPVEKLMSSPLLTIAADAPLGDAMRNMTEKDIRRLYVVQQGRIIGRITQTGLMRKTLEVFLALSTL